MTRVYRVEDENHTGPYWNKRDDWTTHCHDWSNTTPGPHRDGLEEFENGHHVCGFASVEQFSAWFNLQERKNLDARGYRLSVYDVASHQVLIGYHQVAFVPNGAKKIADFNLVLLGVVSWT